MDSQGNTYVADYYNRRIQKFDAQGTFESQFSDCKDGNFNPSVLAVNNTIHSLYAVTDQNVVDSCSPPAYPNYNVVQFDFNGTVIRRWVTCSPNGCPNTATSLTLDSHGIVYVSTYWAVCGGCSPNTELFKFSQNGVLLQRIDLTPTTASYSYVTALATQGGYLYADVSNPSYVRGGICTPTTLSNCRVHKLTLDGTPVDGFGNTTTTLYSGGMTVDANGNIYAGNDTGHNIMRIAANGIPTSTVGGFGQGHGRFFYPSQLALDGKGQFYVADSGNDRVQVFDESWSYVRSFGKTTLHQISNTLLPETSAGSGVYVLDQPPGLAGRLSELDPTGDLLFRIYLDSYITLSAPESIAVNSVNGTIYVAYVIAASYCHFEQIQSIQPNPVTLLSNTRMGYCGQGPPSIAIDKDGFVYGWADSDGLVHKYDSQLRLITTWFPYPPDNNFYGGGIAVDSQGYVYLSNDYHNRLSVYDNSGIFQNSITPAGGAGDVMAIDKTDNILLPEISVANITMYHRASKNILTQLFSLNNTYQTIGIGVDNQGVLYAGERTSGAGGAVSPIYEYSTQAFDPPPTISFTQDATKTLTGVTVNLTITASDHDGTVTNIRVDWGDGTVHTLAGTATKDSHAYPMPGMFSIVVNATDETGQIGRASSTVTILDKPPIVTISGVTPNPAITAQTVRVDFVASDPDGTVTSIKVDWGDGSADLLAGTATSDTHSYTSIGSFKVNVTATDNDGSSGSDIRSLTVSPPFVPVVNVNSPSPNSADTGTKITITFVVTSSVTVASLTIDWGDGITDTPAVTTTTASHMYSSTGNAKSEIFTIKVTAANSAGPGSGTTIETVNDRSPIATITSLSPSPARVGLSVTTTFSATDPDGTVSGITVNWGDGTAADYLSGTATNDIHTYSAHGTFTVTITANDNSGSASTPATTSLTVQPAQAPAITINGLTPKPANTGDTVTLAFTVSSSTTITGITVNWGDGTNIENLQASTTSDTHVFASTGGLKSRTFTVIVTATNNAGPNSVQASEAVNDRRPVASFIQSVTTALTGSSINFDGSGSYDADGSVTTYSWDFADGTPTALGARVAHSFSKPGTYTISLVVTDDSGNTATRTGVVTISLPLAQVRCGENDTCTVLSNSTISNADADRSKITLTATGNKGTIGFANVTVPRAAVPNINRLRVIVDGARLPSSALTITMNATDYFVYFTFAFHSPVSIEVDYNPPPETILGLDPSVFYSTLVGLLMIAVFVAGIGFYRKRRVRNINSQALTSPA